MPGEHMSFVSIDVWTLLMTWGNLIILFFIVKKLLFKPVKKVLQDREDEVKKALSDADDAKSEAFELRDAYEEHLTKAKEEAGSIVKEAYTKAQMRGEDIVRQAQKQASGILKKADEQIARERRQALEETRGQISELATQIASKVVEKEMTAADHEAMIGKIIDEMDEGMKHGSN